MKLVVSRKNHTDNNKNVIPIFNVNSIHILCLFLLTVIFIYLKVKNIIDWNWIWVVSPMWLIIAIPFSIWLFLVFLWLFGNTLIIALESSSDWKRKKQNRF